jgi:predicted RecA/RadA family phage recombinase
MPQAVYVQAGDAIDYLPGVARAAGDVVVQGDLVGITRTEIAANRLGSLALEGVFEFTKATGTALTVGQKVYWDAANQRVSGDSSVGRLVGRVTREAAATDTTVRALLDVQSSPDLLYVAEAASAVISGTVTETAFDKSFTIPANTLQVGDVLRVRAQGLCPSTNATDTLTVKLKLGALVLIATGAVDVNNNDLFLLESDLVVRATGTTGTVVAGGLQALGAEGTVTTKPAKLAASTLDTTAAQAVTVTATWSVANANNQVRLDLFDVELLRKS